MNQNSEQFKTHQQKQDLNHQTATKIVQFLNQSRLRHHQGELYTLVWDDSSNVIQVKDNLTGLISFSATWNDQVANWSNTGTPLTEEIVNYANSLVSRKEQYTKSQKHLSKPLHNYHPELYLRPPRQL